MSSQYEKRNKKKDESGEAKPLNRDAYDVFLDPESNKHVRVRINYNLETGEAKVVESKNIADSQPVAIHKINELFAKKLFKIDYK